MSPSRWLEIKRLFEDAVVLDEAARREFLARACRDGSIRVEIESLLAADDRATSSAYPRSLVPHVLGAGDSLGPYEIEGPVGAGGAGDVYRARDRRLHRHVALKLLRTFPGAGPEFRARVEREARAIASLNHPHICALYDIGTEGESSFLVMEFLDGETLAERLQRGRLPRAEALRFATQIAEALAVAHRQGIVHRDLKPANIMVTGRGAVLLDFGLAKLLTTAGPDVPPPDEATSGPVGTLHYMAPEQLAGDAVDARTDVYAFGALLYEMLTGRKAFSSGEPIGDIALDRIVSRCLDRDPGRRWASGDDLLPALACALRDDRVPPASQGRSRAARFALTATLSLVLLAVASQVRPGSTFLRGDAAATAPRDAAAKAFLRNRPAYGAYLRGRHYMQSRTPESFAKAVAQFNQAIAIDPGFVLAHAGLADAFTIAAYFNLAPPAEVYPKARAAALHAVALDPDVAEAHSSLAAVKLFYEWDFAGADRSYRRALELSPTSSLTRAGYSMFLASQGRMSEALAEATGAKQLDPLSPAMAALEGWMLYFDRQYDAAVRQADNALESEPAYAVTHQLLADALLARGGSADELRGYFERYQVPASAQVHVTYLAAVRGDAAARAAAFAMLRDRRHGLPSQPVMLAARYLALGYRAEALQELERGYATRAGQMIWLKISPALDALRDDPAFVSLLRRVGFDRPADGS